MEIIRITDDKRQLIEPQWLARAESVHRQLRPQLAPDYVGKMLAVFASGGEMCVVARDERVVGIAVFRYFENTHVGHKFYVDDLVTDENSRSGGVGHAMLTFLEPGAYTVLINGPANANANNSSGLVLVEVYEANP